MLYSLVYIDAVRDSLTVQNILSSRVRSFEDLADMHVKTPMLTLGDRMKLGIL